MNNTIRYIIAGVLIFLIILLQPIYLKWLGYDYDYEIVDSGAPVEGLADPGIEEDGVKHDFPIYENNPAGVFLNNESFITISTPLYAATLTNRSGGSFVDYTLLEEKSGKLRHVGGYDDQGVYHPDRPVSMIMPSRENCMPCLAYFDDRVKKYNGIKSILLNLSFQNKN